MNPSLNIDKLLRSRRRTIGLEITRDAKLVVRAPFRVSLEDIQKLVLRKANWIYEKINFVRQYKIQSPPKEFVNGESFYYLGMPYQFKLIDKGAIRLTQYLEFPKTLLWDAKQHLIQWYKTIAYEKIKERVDWYSKIIGLSYSTVKISGARKRLGSCGVRGNLNFSWRLIMAPLEIVDYVVVHELIHLYERSHSHVFWNKVRGVLPDYKEKESFLKHNYRLFDL